MAVPLKHSINRHLKPPIPPIVFGFNHNKAESHHGRANNILEGVTERELTKLYHMCGTDPCRFENVCQQFGISFPVKRVAEKLLIPLS